MAFTVLGFGPGWAADWSLSHMMTVGPSHILCIDYQSVSVGILRITNYQCSGIDRMTLEGHRAAIAGPVAPGHFVYQNHIFAILSRRFQGFSYIEKNQNYIDTFFFDRQDRAQMLYFLLQTRGGAEDTPGCSVLLG